MRILRGLAGRVAIATLAAVGLSLVATGAILLREIEAEGRRAIDEELRERASSALTIGAKPGGDPISIVKSDPLLYGSGTFTRIVVDGEMRLERGDRVPEGFPLPRGPGFDTSGGWRTLTATYGSDTLIQFAARMAPVTERTDRIQRVLVGLGLAALAGSALLGWAFGAFALRPVRRLRRAAAGVVGTQDLHARLPAGTGPTEVLALSRSLNEMLERLERSSAETERALGAARRFAADVGHEVRTPLQTIRVNVDVLRRNPDMPPGERTRVLTEIGAAHARLLRLLDALQRLARGDAQPPEALEPVDLIDLADASVEAARRRHPGRVLTYVDGADSAIVHGSPEGLATIVDNLLENALLHGGPEARVALGISVQNGVVRLVVDDDGPGVPAAHREAIFGRFVRGPAPGGEGSGLGLALVAQQASAHHGAVQVDDAPGGGARFTLTLPRAHDSHTNS